MVDDRPSLLPGRRSRALEKREVQNVINTFLGMEGKLNVDHDPAGRTRFRVREEEGELIGEVLFGPDIYPGTEIVNPNSTLSMEAAAAHEISHFHRWKNATQINDLTLEDIDEALTSLDAAIRFADLHVNDKLGLVSDAMQRLAKYAAANGNG